MAEGTTIPLRVSRRHRRVANHFCAYHALSPVEAVAYKPETPEDRKQLEAMFGLGIVHQTVPGHYWIDLAALKADQEAQAARMWPVGLLIAVILAGSLMARLAYQ